MAINITPQIIATHVAMQNIRNIKGGSVESIDKRIETIDSFLWVLAGVMGIFALILIGVLIFAIVG
jgi:hypothetical protein